VPPKKRKAEDDYEPVRCGSCEEEIYQQVQVTVKCPMGWKNLSKDGIRDKRVQIVGAVWGDSQWFCGCQPKPPSKAEKKPVVDRRVRKAGKRWAKNNVPSSLSEAVLDVDAIPFPSPPTPDDPEALANSILEVDLTSLEENSYP
jgi:hypothetical protein